MPRKKFRRLPDGFGGIIPTAARQIVGHSSGDVHVSVYTKHSPEYLLEEIKKLKYL